MSICDWLVKIICTTPQQPLLIPFPFSTWSAHAMLSRPHSCFSRIFWSIHRWNYNRRIQQTTRKNKALRCNETLSLSHGRRSPDYQRCARPSNDARLFETSSCKSLTPIMSTPLSHRIMLQHVAIYYIVVCADWLLAVVSYARRRFAHPSRSASMIHCS